MVPGLIRSADVNPEKQQDPTIPGRQEESGQNPRANVPNVHDSLRYCMNGLEQRGGERGNLFTTNDRGRRGLSVLVRGVAVPDKDVACSCSF